MMQRTLVKDISRHEIVQGDLRKNGFVDEMARS